LSDIIKVTILRKMVWTEKWQAGGGGEDCIKGTSEGRTPFGRARCIWKAIIKINIKELLWEGVTWINLAEDKDQWQVLANTVIKGWIS
jgi:hypothetical protein